MNREKLAEFLKDIQEQGDPCRLIYYCKASKCTFFVRVVDQKGAPVPKQHSITGAIERSGGKPVFEELKKQFTPVVPQRSKKSDAVCCFEVKSNDHGKFSTQDKEVVAVLEQMADDNPNEILREEAYKMEQNPKAYEAEKRLAALEARHKADLDDAYQRGLAENAGAVNELKKQLEDAESQLSDEPEPTTAPSADK
jgi:hypothetical protein